VRPTSAQILRGVVANLEELIVPQLEGPHAQSAGANVVMLLEHVILRLESEGEALAADNGEKRALLGLLGDVPAPLEGAAREVTRRLAGIPENGPYVSVDALTDENERLKSVLDGWLSAVHAASDVDEAESSRLCAPIRTQLRAQVDREAAFVAPIALERIFGNEDG